MAPDVIYCCKEKTVEGSRRHSSESLLSELKRNLCVCVCVMRRGCFPPEAFIGLK